MGAYDARARVLQPVEGRKEPRFLDRQLAQCVEESGAECERHASALLEGASDPPFPPPLSAKRPPDASNRRLAGHARRSQSDTLHTSGSERPK